MKSIYKLSLFLLLLLIISFIFTKFINYRIIHSDNSKISWILNQRNEHYTNVFIGASKIEKGINPYIIDSICKNGKSVNLGYHGFSYIDIYIILEKFLANNKADNIYIDVEPLTILNFDFTKYNAYYNSYIPYISETNLKKHLKNDKVWYCWKYIPFYRYIDSRDAINNYISYSKVDFLEKKGYTQKGINPYISDMFEMAFEKKHDIKVSETQIDYIEKIIQLLQGKTKLHFMVTPNHVHTDKTIAALSVYKDAKIRIDSIITKNNIPFINWNKLFKLRSDDYFEDDMHLNIKGSEKFSSILSDSLCILY